MNARKTCPACGKKLSAGAFNDSSKTADGLARVCRECTNARRRELGRSANERPQRRHPSTVLATALRQGDIKGVRKLIRAGVTPQWDWVSETMRGGQVRLANVLLDSGVERNVFTMAAMAETQGLTRRLRRVRGDARLAAGMEPASDQVTPLHVGSSSDWRSHGPERMAAQVRVAEILVEHGADLHAAARYRGIAGATPLFCACWSSGNLALVRWLLARGAPATDAHLAAALGHLQRHGQEAYDVAEALLEWGVPVDGNGGRTPLQAFAHQGIHKTVAWLIAHGADVNSWSSGGRQAVHLASERNTGPKTLALLVAAGADLSVRDEDGRTPLEIARLNGKMRLVEWIKKRLRVKKR